MTKATGSAVIAGFGPGLGQQLADKLVADGLKVGLMARSVEKLESAANGFEGGVFPLPAGLTDADAVEAAVDHAENKIGPIECAVFNASMFLKGSILDFSPADFEKAWRVSAYGGFVFGQAVAKRMVTREAGTIIFSGATASLRGNAMSYVILDGVIRGHKYADPGGDAHMDPKDLAEIYMSLHRQPRSTWTHELDVRPWCEKF